MSATEVLFLEIIRMHSIIRSTDDKDEWRWVMSTTAVDLLRDYARTLGAGEHLDGEATMFGMPIRVDDAAVHPMLELRR